MDDPDAVALLIYTSGSTAAPKAVVSPHKSVLFAARAIASRLRYQERDVVLTAIPLAFDYGLYQVFLCLLAGAHLVLGEPTGHVRLIPSIHGHGVTVVPVVPSLAEMLVRLAGCYLGAGSAGTAVHQHRRGAHRAAHRRVARAVPVRRGLDVRHHRVQADHSVRSGRRHLARPGWVGRALDGTEVLILDGAGVALPAGQVGEIVVRGPHVMRGYWRAPQLTAERFRRDPSTGELTLHTGDFGRLDADGHLYFEGRRDDMFKRRGLRVSALEIEAATCDIDGVRAAAVLPPADGREAILFAVTDLTEEVVGRLGERLEERKVPSICHVVAELPLTANGKTDKRRLAELLGVPESEGSATP